MKLDSIIYDTSTLATALTESLTNESPTFKAMYPSETSTALVNLLAGYGSMLQYTIVSALANCYTNTAFSPTAIYQLAETLGNRLHGNVSAKLYCNIERTSLRGQPNIVIPKNSVFQVEGVPFFNNDPIVFTQNVNNVYNVLLTQGEYTIVEFTTSGAPGEKFYFSNDFKCNMDMVRVFINDQEWSTTDSFLSLNSMQLIDQEQATTVMLRMSSDGRAFIKIGNNSNGSLPASGSIVRIEYVSNEGSKGNIEKTNMAAELMTQIYGVDNSVDTLLTVDIITPQPSYGGFDTQSLETLKESSPYVFASGDRAVRREDYKALLLNKCGYISANAWGEYEEAQTNGGYDKIMMNMVYYTGIKEIQRYDYRPMQSLTIPDDEDAISSLNPVYYTDSVGTIRGFPGSYEIDLIYSVDETQRIKYTDKNGNGVLVCDPSDNNRDISLFPYNNAPELYDSGNPGAAITIEAVQDVVSGHGILQLISNNDTDFISNGTTSGTAPIKLSFDTPLQIELKFSEAVGPQAISMFAFKTPHDSDDLDLFPSLVSIYATDEMNGDSTFTTNVKNNSDWTRIAEMQTINIPEEEGEWSDWITTNLYNPSVNTGEKTEDGWRKYQRYIIEFYTLHDETKNVWGAQCHIGQMKFVLNKKQSMRYAWGGNDQGDGTKSPVYYTKTENPSGWSENADQSEYVIYDSNLNEVTDFVVKEVRTEIVGGESVPYLMFVDSDSHTIEATDICSVNKTARNNISTISASQTDGGSSLGTITVTRSTFETQITTSGSYVFVFNGSNWTFGETVIDLTDYGISYTGTAAQDDKITVVYKASSSEDKYGTDYKTSTIDYENNSLVDMCIPALASTDTTAGVQMSYYKYSIEISGLTAANGYKTNDRLCYSFNNGKFANVLITNIDTGSYDVTINNTMGTLTDPTATQVGNRKLDVQDVDLEYSQGYSGNGSGAKLTVSSENAVGIYGTFTGNAYSTATAQSIDSPVIEQYNHFTTYVEFKQPRVKNVRIDVTVEYSDSYSYKDTRKKVEEAINSVFDITPYYIGKSLNVSDIWAAINNVAGVKRFIVTYPVDNISCKPYEFIALPANNLTITDKFSEDFK